MGTEQETTAEVGSQDSVDVLSEDVEDDDRARAIGYLGKGSDVQWLRRARERRFENPGNDTDISGPYGPPGTPGDASSDRMSRRQKRSAARHEPLSAATYHLDEQNMLDAQAVDPDEMPTNEVATTLFDHYMCHVNTEFPFIECDWTVGRLKGMIHHAQEQDRKQLQLGYRAILNIIFAIGASYAHLIGDAQGDERDHFLYYTRARMLGLDGCAFVEHPNHQLVQICALTGFYYLCRSQISRCVTIVTVV